MLSSSGGGGGWCQGWEQVGGNFHTVFPRLILAFFVCHLIPKYEGG